MPTPLPVTDLRSLIAALFALAEPVAERVGVTIVAIEVTGASGVSGRILRVSVDKPGGSTITDCSRFSRIFSPALDAADLIASTYTLEVSTPGIDRPVQRIEDFERFVGCTVRLKTWDMDGRRRLKCVIKGVDGDEILFEVDGVPRRYHKDDIERGALVLDLEQYERLGQGLPPGPPASAPAPVAKPGRALLTPKTPGDGGNQPPKPKPTRKNRSTP